MRVKKKYQNSLISWNHKANLVINWLFWQFLWIWTNTVPNTCFTANLYLYEYGFKLWYATD